jgi:hypothetical protein
MSTSDDYRRPLTPYRFQENLQQKMMREGYQLRQELFPWELDQIQRYSELEPRPPEWETVLKTLTPPSSNSTPEKQLESCSGNPTHNVEATGEYSTEAPAEEKKLGHLPNKQSSYVIPGVLTHVLPEECRGELEALRKRWLNDQKLPKGRVGLLTAQVLLDMLLGCLRTKLQNCPEAIQNLLVPDQLTILSKHFPDSEE